MSQHPEPHRSVLQRALGTRAGEGRPTFALAANAFFAAAASIALARVVASRAADALPFSLVALVPVAGVASVGLYWLGSRWRHGLALSLAVTGVATAGLGAGVVLGWGRGATDTPDVVVGLAVVFYHSLAAILVAHAFAFATYVLDEESGLRLLPLVGAGAVAGALVGRLAVIPIYSSSGPLAAMGFAAACLLGTPLVAALSGPWRGTAKVMPPSGESPDAERAGVLATRGRTGYLAVAALLVGFTGFALSAQEHHWDALLRGDPGRLRALHSGVLWIGGGALALPLHLFVVGRWLRGLGVRASLVVLPLAGLLTSLPFVLLGREAQSALWWSAVPTAALQTTFYGSALRALFLRVDRGARLGPQVAISVLAAGAGSFMGGWLVTVWLEGHRTAGIIVVIAGWSAALVVAWLAGTAFSRRDRAA